MERYTGSCEKLASVEVEGIAHWIKAIPFSAWPQQRPVDSQLRPAMVTDTAWHGFGNEVHDLVTGLMNNFPECAPYQRMLSVVMPGHSIEPHHDAQGPDWICRVHVPLQSNSQAFTTMLGKDINLKVGSAYKLNTEETHSIRNGGKTPRIHFMFDVRRL